METVFWMVKKLQADIDPSDRNSIPTRLRHGIRPLTFRQCYELGTGNAGVVETNFDVTPLVNQMDGVIGYADSSVGISA